LARAYRVNRYVRGEKSDAKAVEALAGLRRFPAWMWRNTAVVEFIEWLRAYNDELDVSIRGMNWLVVFARELDVRKMAQSKEDMTWKK